MRGRGPRAKGLTKRGVMNGLEARYAERLNTLKAAGHIKWWDFEAMRLKVSDRVIGAASGNPKKAAVYYTPDFCVLTHDDEFQIIEVKGGHWAADSLVRFKAAVTRWPFRFFVARQDLQGWNVQLAADYLEETHGQD